MSKPLCLLAAPVFNRSGYGDWSTDVAKSLLRYDKYDLMIHPLPWGKCQSRRFFEDLTDPEEIELTKKLLQPGKPLPKQPDIYIGMSIPNEFQTIGKYNIGMTAGIETNLCTGEFLEGVNKVDLTIALSNHAADVFKNTKLIKHHQNGQKEPLELKKPLEVCFWGADTSVYKKSDELVESVDAKLSQIKEKFNFLFIGQWTTNSKYGDRKDIGNLIKTFLKTFKNFNENDRPGLILKSGGASYCQMDRYSLLKIVNEIKNEVGGDNLPNVYILHGELSPKEMNALINHDKVKCHVSFTHGEGYGHPLLLQSLSGKPILVPKWSGHIDFLQMDEKYYLPGTLDVVPNYARNPWILKESKWFNVSYNLAENKLKSIYYKHNNDKVINEFEKLRKYNEEHFSIQAMDEKLWSILDQYVPKFAVQNQFVIPKLKPINNSSNDNNTISLPKLKPKDDIKNKIVLPKLTV